MTVADLQVTILDELVHTMKENQTEVDFTSREFRDAMGKFATGVVAISSCHNDQPHAMTANAFMSGSLEPPLVIVSVGKKAASHEKISLGQRFGISILNENQMQVSNHFAGKRDEKFNPKFEYIDGFPVIENASVQLVAKLQFAYPCGDHTLFVGLVTNLRQQEDIPPLMYHCGQHKQLAY